VSSKVPAPAPACSGPSPAAHLSPLSLQHDRSPVPTLLRLCRSRPAAPPQGVGAPGQALAGAEFAALLAAGGADGRWATPAWAANHLRWVAWKLAALERRHPAALAGRALTAPVVLDQLKYRRARPGGRACT